MDSSVIQEIANQLGIAADKVWEFAPEYGAMMVGSGLVELAVTLGLLVAFVAIAAIAYTKESLFRVTVWDGVFYFSVVMAIVCGALFVVALCGVGDMWAWANHPQAMMAKLVISKIG